MAKVTVRIEDLPPEMQARIEEQARLERLAWFNARPWWFRWSVYLLLAGLSVVVIAGVVAFGAGLWMGYLAATGQG